MTTMIKENVSFMLCIENKDCDDLEKGKVYRQITDPVAAEEGYVRIVDESSEDYLYPKSYLVKIQLPERAQKVLIAAC